jgi:GNAT superfamily N-acetyltransferase
MLNFRLANVHDAKAIAKLHAQSWQENYRLDFSAKFLDEEAFEDRLNIWQHRLKNPAANQYVILAENGVELVGFGCAFFDENKQYGTLLDNLHVAKKAKGLGIGKKLMKHISRAALKEATSKKMYLWVLENNKSAFDVYIHWKGKFIETVEGADIGDKVIRKSRIFWEDLNSLL